jgi:hypothetical protein
MFPPQETGAPLFCIPREILKKSGFSLPSRERVRRHLDVYWVVLERFDDNVPSVG